MRDRGRHAQEKEMRALAVPMGLLLAIAGPLPAQTAQTDNKPIAKHKVTPDAAPDPSGARLDHARVKQGKGESDGAQAAPEDAAAGLGVEPDEPRAPLTARLFLTRDPAGFQKAYDAGEAPLPTTNTIGVTTPVMAIVALSGCTRGKDGKCSIEFTSRTAGPDGAFDAPRTSPPWKPEPIRGKPELAPARFGLRLGPGDPPGRYTIEVAISDAVAKTRKVLTASVTKPTAAGGR
jgi:hypothetical protein